MKNEIYSHYQEHQNSSLPFAIEVDSGKPGKHLMFVGTLHGHEPAGAIASAHIHQQILSGETKLKQGKVTFVLGNPEAFLQSQRFVNKNLNRVFLDDLEEHLEGLRAQQFRTYFKSQKVDYVFDLHSVSVGDFHFAIYHENEEMRKIALAVSPAGIHLIINSVLVPGTLVEEVSKYGGSGIVFECGNNNNPQTVEIAKHHIISSMIYFGLIDEVGPEAAQIDIPGQVTIYKVKDIIKPHPDFRFIDPNVSTGTFIKKSDVYALYNGGELLAKEDYYIVMPDKKPNIDDHDAGFLCTKTEINRN